MNRHKTYWSQMHDERKEPSVKEQHFIEFEKQLITLFNMYDKTEVLTIVRKVYESIN